METLDRTPTRSAGNASEVPAERIHPCNSHQVNGSAGHVLYWMLANRRRHYNFALQRAVHWASELRRPLLIVEGLNSNYRWASSRFQTALLQGMLDNSRAFANSAARYYPYVERLTEHARGMMDELASRAAVVVTDDFPTLEITRWIAAVAARSPVLLEKVDSNGIFPMQSTDRVFTTAHSFRRFLQKELRAHLQAFPMADPLDQVELPPVALPESLQKRWPEVLAGDLMQPDAIAASLPVDRSVLPVPCFAGGAVAGRERLKQFVGNQIESYADTRNQPDVDSSSGLSPYLHFGHISAHEIFLRVMSRDQWSAAKLNPKATGSRAGWWNAGPGAEAFLDQLVTWREIGFNMCAHADDYASYESLPPWSRATLAAHASDPRPESYSRAELEGATTHDPLWNAAQNQLASEGRIHNYLRMLWGKKILEWSLSPLDALETMIHLNNKYALDGRDPNSYSGIFWILGRYDRPWAPERPIFGRVRYMSSANTSRKLRVRDYVRRYTPEPATGDARKRGDRA